VDALKLDRSVVQRAFNGERDTGMIALILHIAEYLGVPVAAVGVESEEQYRYLKDLGCGLVQGYWFSGPIPPEDFRRYLEK
jgi:EAL domain-containing protein (putative c-di-GMP-specific phosphodiesterase class I)